MASVLRGQAAMEFLMTYGWAVLVIMVVLGVLFFAGVFNTSALIPRSCTFPAGFTCSEFELDQNGNLLLDLGNGMGRMVTVYGVGCASDGSYRTFTALDAPVQIPSGSHAWVTNTTITCTGAAAPTFRGKISINYTLAGSNLVPRYATADVYAPYGGSGTAGPTPTPVYTYISSLPYIITSPGNYSVSGDLTSAGNGIVVNAAGRTSVIDCGGRMITGPGFGAATFGIYLNRTDNVIVRNCVVTNFYAGAEIVLAGNNTLTANTLHLDYYGVYSDASANNTISNNLITNSSNSAIFVFTSTNTTIGSNRMCNCSLSYYNANCNSAQVDGGSNKCDTQMGCGITCGAC